MNHAQTTYPPDDDPAPPPGLPQPAPSPDPAPSPQPPPGTPNPGPSAATGHPLEDGTVSADQESGNEITSFEQAQTQALRQQPLH